MLLIKKTGLLVIVLCQTVLLIGGAIPSELLTLYLDMENIPESDMESYLEQFVINPLQWDRCNITDIETLPLNDHIKEKLIIFKNRNIQTENWSDFQKEARLKDEEIELIEFFFEISEKRSQHKISAMNFFSLKTDPDIDIHKNLLRGKIVNNNGGMIGIVVERDCDERAVWDYRNVCLKTALLRDRLEISAASFRFNWGHGLLFSMNGMAGKSANVMGNILPRSQRFGVYMGSDENRYLHGINLTCRLKKITMYSLVSYHKLDATIKDSVVESFRTSGSHVTDAEIAGKDALSERTICGGVLYSKADNQWGVLFYQSQYSYPVAKFNRNSGQTGLSVYNKFAIGSWMFSGEYALLGTQEHAFVQGFIFSQAGYKVGIQIRYFSDWFFTPLSSVMKEYSGTTANERALYLGIQGKLNSNYRLGAYIDFFAKNRSMEPGVDPPRGTNALISLRRRWRGRHFLDFRYKRRSISQSVFENILKNQLSLSARYNILDELSVSMRSAVVKLQKGADKNTGMAVSVYSTIKSPGKIKLTAGTTHFYSTASNSRVYLYEPGTPLRFNMVSLNGTGYRWFLTLQKEISESFVWITTAKIQTKRGIADKHFHRTAVIEFQMLVDL